jgi:hypothetical protein
VPSALHEGASTTTVTSELEASATVSTIRITLAAVLHISTCTDAMPEMAELMSPHPLAVIVTNVPPADIPSDGLMTGGGARISKANATDTVALPIAYDLTRPCTVGEAMLYAGARAEMEILPCARFFSERTRPVTLPNLVITDESLVCVSNTDDIPGAVGIRLCIFSHSWTHVYTHLDIYIHTQFDKLT